LQEFRGPAFPCYMYRVRIRLQPKPFGFIHVRIEDFRSISRLFMNGKTVPHNTTKHIFKKFNTSCKLIVNMFPSDQIKYKLIRIQGAYNQFTGSYLGAIIELYSFSRAIFYTEV